MCVEEIDNMKALRSQSMSTGALESATRAAEAAGVDVVMYSEFEEMRARLDSRGFHQV